MARYSFKPAIEDPANWIWKYIDYAKECTDAPYEYHEAYALFLLSLATAGVRLYLSPYPNGLRTNLYVLIYGTSSLMRKSTAMDIALDMQGRALTFARLPENFTPGGLEEAVAERPGVASALFIDEFTGIIDKMNHQNYMAGTKSFLLTMYSRDSWDYARRAKQGKKDQIEIKDAHLCIAGNVTPAVSNRLMLTDVDDGFLARFAIIKPHAKPARRRLYDLQVVDRIKRADVCDELLQIYRNTQRAAAKTKTAEAKITAEGLKRLDEFQDEAEQAQSKASQSGVVMLERVMDMATKTSMLIAAGRPDGFADGPLLVTETDVLQAMALTRKWSEWAVEFADSIQQSPDEQRIIRIMNYLERNGGIAPRRDLLRQFKIFVKQLDDLQSTMIERGLIGLREEASNGSHKPTLYWYLKDQEEENEGLTITPLDDAAGPTAPEVQH